VNNSLIIQHSSYATLIGPYANVKYELIVIHFNKSRLTGIELETLSNSYTILSYYTLSSCTKNLKVVGRMEKSEKLTYTFNILVHRPFQFK
jgi:hypothetical protein